MLKKSFLLLTFLLLFILNIFPAAASVSQKITCGPTNNCPAETPDCVIPQGQTTGTCQKRTEANQALGVVNQPADIGPVKLNNPLKASGVETPQQFVGHVINILMGVIGSIALAMFTWGGFQWLIAMGDSKKVQTGKDIMKWTAFGMAMIFMAYAVTRALIEVITTK